MSNQDLHDDRRQSSREGRLVSGTIVYNGNADIMICIVLNISDGGAKLRPADALHCPDRFSLKVAGQPARDCKVVWRRESQIGVKFEPAQTRIAEA